MRLLSRLAIIGLVVGSCVGCDQATKAIAQHHLSGQEPLHFLGGVVRLAYVENTGAFLSMGSGLSPKVRFWSLGVAVGIALGFLAAFVLFDPASRLGQVVLVGLVVGGGIGNLLDRLSSGVVRDFLNLGIGPLRTGIFNLADVAVTLGGVALLVAYCLGRERT